MRKGKLQFYQWVRVTTKIPCVVMLARGKKLRGGLLTLSGFSWGGLFVASQHSIELCERTQFSKLGQPGYVREDGKGKRVLGIMYLFSVSCHHVSAKFHLLSHFVNNLLGLIGRLRLKVVLFRLVGPPDD
jgi:hypothetical protein